MASQVEITNLALSRIGANTITSLTDGTAEQKLAVVTWDIARRACLRDHAWNFACKDVELNQISGYTAFEYDYAYQLPSDYIRLLQFYGNPNFRVQGRRILTDETVCKIKYIYDVTDSPDWDASFTDLMAQRMAVDMAYALTKSQSSADSMYAIYNQKLKLAKHIDSTEDVPDQLGGDDSIYIAVRG
jgi:hypothetical protein